MKLVRSDSPEITNSISSAGALACWGWSVPTLVCIASAPGLLILIIASLIVSVRAGALLGAPVILASNAYWFWRRSPHRSWVIASCSGRVFVRMFMHRGKGRFDEQELDTIMFEASEVASMAARIVEVFLYGPKSRTMEWLVIETPQAIAHSLPERIRPLLKPSDPDKQIYATNEAGCLVVNWKWCRPDLQAFLSHVARECPSVAIDLEKRSELDLNGIWNSHREKPDAKQRQMLVQAKRLGFGCECATLLARHRAMSFEEAAAYLTEIEPEEAGTEQSIGCSSCQF